MRDYPELMFPWTPIMDGPVDDDERDMTANYFHANIPSKSPREALQPLIDKYRGLQYIIKPPRGGIGHELYLQESNYLRPYDGPEDRREESEASDREILSVSRRLKDLYLWCGWNDNTVEQVSFRRDEFIEEGEKFLAGRTGRLVLVASMWLVCERHTSLHVLRQSCRPDPFLGHNHLLWKPRRSTGLLFTSIVFHQHGH